MIAAALKFERGEKVSFVTLWMCVYPLLLTNEEEGSSVSSCSALRIEQITIHTVLWLILLRWAPLASQKARCFLPSPHPSKKIQTKGYWTV